MEHYLNPHVMEPVAAMARMLARTNRARRRRLLTGLLSLPWARIFPGCLSALWSLMTSLGAPRP
jgi:hypothetical protein